MQRNCFIIVFLLAFLFMAAIATAEEERLSSYQFPWLGNRTVLWVVAQFHLNFAAFILGAPLFVLICEWIGWRTQEAKYERLAYEMAKVTVMAYSLTALTGGFLTLLLIGLYPRVTTFLTNLFAPLVLLIYPALFLLETLLLYTYWYSWNALQKRKELHITLGVLLNLTGTLTMLAMNAVASFMLTPLRAYETATLWQLMNNFTWWPLNIHRFIANITFGGFITGLVAALMYLTAKSQADRAFYDWMGFVGNLIGLFTFILLVFPGYLYGREIYQYDASLGIYMMSDRLSMFFEMQGLLIGLIFLAGNYYIWLSMKRIEGAQRFAPVIKAGFVLLLICNAIWITPRHFIATMIPEPGMTLKMEELELPAHLGFLALMPAKNTAAALSIVVVLTSYLFYRITLCRGKVAWGEIDPRSQYVLIFLAFAAMWTMGLMGAVRELARKHFHIYLVMPDMTTEAYTPTLAWSSLLITLITLVFFWIMGFIIWLSLKVGKQEREQREE